MIKLNLGCGAQYLKGYINTDNNRRVKADKYFDLNTIPYPFPSNYADLIIMDNVLEHLGDIVAVMEELHRVLKPGGILEIIVPYAKSDGSLQDPTHKHFFTEKSMDYFTGNNDYQYYTKVKFQLLKNELGNINQTFLSKLRLIIPFKNILRYIIFNMYDHVHFKLRAAK